MTENSCIVSSIADCVFGVARLISSARQNCVKIGPCLELEKPLAVGRFHHHVRAQNVGRHQVGRELNARKMQIERLGQRAHQQRFAQARHAFQQTVAADEQASEHAVHDIVVADDHSADLFSHRLIPRAELFRPLLHLFADRHGGGVG